MSESKKFVQGTPPVVREAAEIVRRGELAVVGTVLSGMGACVGLFLGAVILDVSGATGLAWAIPATGGALAIGVPVMGLIVHFLSEAPSSVATSDARAVLKAWEEERQERARQLVREGVRELEEADPRLVEAWESGQGARALPRERA